MSNLNDENNYAPIELKSKKPRRNKNTLSENNNSGFLKQFEPLKHSSKEVFALNSTEGTISGVDANIKRKIQLNEGFSDFNDRPMRYDAVKGKLKHKNMKPFTSRRDNFIDLEKDSRRMRHHTGADEYWKHKKESKSLFKPQRDLSHVHGMPNYTQKVKNRYIPSMYKNKIDLPGSRQYVGPGINGKDQQGLYNNTRILPKTSNELRTLNNQMVSYEGRTVDGRKGHKSAPKPNFTKIKKKTFKENTKKDLVKSRASRDKQKMRERFHNPDNYKGGTARSKSMSYAGTAAMYNDKIASSGNTNFNHSAKQSHTFEKGPYTGQTKFNNNKISYPNRDNERTSTQYEYQGNPDGRDNKYINTYNKPRTTLKESINYGILPEEERKILTRGSILKVNNNGTFKIKLDDTRIVDSVKFSEIKCMGMPVEGKNINYVEYKSGIYYKERKGNPNITHDAYINNYEEPDTTLKEANIYQYEGNPNVDHNKYINFYEEPDPTIRNTTNFDHIKKPNIEKMTNQTTYLNFMEKPDTTLKETVSYDTRKTSNIEKGIKNQNYINFIEKPDTTIGETTRYENIRKSNIQRGIQNNNYINNINRPDVTDKETLIYDGIPKSSIERGIKNQNYINNIQKPETTIGETTSYDGISKSNIDRAPHEQNYLNNIQVPDTTTKETALYDGIPTSRIEKGLQQDNYINNMNRPKTTIKESTLQEGEGNLKQQTMTYLNNIERPRTTLKETTLKEQKGNISIKSSTYVNNKKPPRTTLKETTLDTREGLPVNERKSGYINNYVAPTTLKEGMLKERTGAANIKNKDTARPIITMRTTSKEGMLRERTGAINMKGKDNSRPNIVMPATSKEGMLKSHMGTAVGTTNTIKVRNDYRNMEIKKSAGVLPINENDNSRGAKYGPDKDSIKIQIKKKSTENKDRPSLFSNIGSKMNGEVRLKKEQIQKPRKTNIVKIIEKNPFINNIIHRSVVIKK
jgi:hypothetical protein